MKRKKIPPKNIKKKKKIIINSLAGVMCSDPTGPSFAVYRTHLLFVIRMSLGEKYGL
jgi:hypothetical protein